MRIEKKYIADKDSPRAHEVGSYVRKVGADMGTGIVVAVMEVDVLDEKTNKVVHQRVYQVHWLQMNNGSLYATEAEADIAPSARAVPKFQTMEEAEKWMEEQLQGGNWTKAAQDAADSSSDMDVELRKILEEGLGNNE